MLNYLWAFIILTSILSAIINGRISELSNAVITGSRDAITLTISILGLMCFWMGIMKIAEKSTLTQKIAKFFEPFIKFIFPNCKHNPKAFHAICMNITANLLGLGNAATPFGIKAMQELQKTNLHPKTATDDMIMLTVINTAALQLIPTMLLGLRQKHGSQNPMKIIPFLWVTSICALIIGITVAKLYAKKKGD